MGHPPGPDDDPRGLVAPGVISFGSVARLTRCIRRHVGSASLPLLASASLLGGPGGLNAQQAVPDWLLSLRFPNAGAKSVMTPTGWGAAYGSVFAGLGVSERNPYLPSSDGVMALGAGVGDPVRNLGVQLGVTVSDLSEFDNYAYSFKLHRYLGQGTAIAVARAC